jgi:hypothetical protein
MKSSVGEDCNGAGRFPSDRTSGHAVLTPGKRLKNDQIKTGDGTSRFNSAHRDG